MGLTLVTGPANSAKAQVVLDRYRLALARGPILVVPRAADVEHYSRELAGSGAVFGVRVEPFSGLLREIARRAGLADAAIGEAGRERVLAAVIARTPLAALAPAAQAPGFARALSGFVAELETRRATPARFASAIAAWAGTSERRARYGAELAALYSGYRRTLERIGRLDGELQAIHALDALALAPARWGRTPVFCYGFDDLDPLQLDAIETLAHRVGAQVTISLPGEPGRIALAERAATLEVLRPGADEVVTLDPVERFYEAPALHHLERSLFEDEAPAPTDPGDAVALLEGGDERAEAELIAGEIEALIAAGAAPGEIAVVTRGGASVAALVAEVLDARGIAHTAARRERLADTALGGGLLALLRAALLDGGAGELVRWLRVPGLVAQGPFVDRFEADLLARGIGELAPARAAWELEHWPLDAFERLAQAAARPGGALIDRVEREAEALFAAPWRREAALLDRWPAAVLASARRTLRELRELARADASLDGGARAIVAALEAATVELGPSSEADAVLICDALALRARRVRALFIAGLQEGEFPAAPHEEAFLSLAERAELAIASGLLLAGRQSAERYLFYALCSRATRWLRISWHDATDDGDAAVRSLFVDDLVDCFGEELFERRAVRGAGALAQGASAAPTLAALAAALAAPRRRAPVLGAMRDPQLLRRLRGRDSYSPSALESWCSCPVAWLVERALRADELRPQGVWITRGSAAHDVLNELFAALLASHGSARIDQVTLPAALALLDGAIDGFAPPLSPNPAVDRAERRRLRSDLRRYLSFAASSSSTHQPHALELAFGVDGAALPAVSLGAGALELVGRIDRVDVDAASGTAIVYDYKTGAVDPAANWVEHRRLQQALYMLAVEELLESRPSAASTSRCAAGTCARAARYATTSTPTPPCSRTTACRGAPARARGHAVADRGGGGGGVARRRAGAAPAELHQRRRLPLPRDLPRGGAVSVALSAEQRRAVAWRSGPLALSANAGSGKTSVLVERYVQAVLEDGIAPSRILAITFTDRAAGELRERVRARLAAAGERQAARDSLAAFVSTFHGFCARLLRTHAVLAGRSPDFVVLGEAQAMALREAAFDAALARWLDDPAALELAAGFGVEELAVAIGAVYDELRSRGEREPALPAAAVRREPGEAAAALGRATAAVAAELAAAPVTRTLERALGRLERAAALIASGEAEGSPALVDEIALRNGSSALSTPACEAYEQARAGYGEACADALGAPAVAALDALLRAFAAGYAARKASRGVVDFDDLELEAGALLERHEDVRALWSARFELLMVDELQDSNARQMALLAALDRDNLFTVGDEFQSIYGFRHADVTLFRQRRDTLGARGAASVLSANYRSRAPLLDAVNAVFAPRFGNRFVPLVAGRADAPPTAPAIELLLADSEGWEPHEERLGVELAPAPLWRRAEARALAARIDELIRSGEAGAEDVVVLFRAAAAIWVYEAALADRGHATLATAGGGFFSRPEVVDLVAYLRALANPLDELALYGVLASPLCGADADALVALALGAREAQTSLWERLQAAPPDARSGAFAARLAAARREAPERGLGEIVAAAVAENGYDLALAALHSPERRIANVRKLERLARDFEAREGRDLRRFVTALSLGRVGSARETEAPPPAAGTGAIRLMTIHGAKGLEFPVVCIADLGHQLRDRPPALLTDGRRVGLRMPTPERRNIDTLAFAELRAERAHAARAEEDRVTYVAMTRARERLILSGAARFDPWPAEGAAVASWLAPALVEDLPRRAAAAAAGGAGAPPAVTEIWGAGDVALRLTLCSPANADQLLWRPAGTDPPEPAGAAPAVGEPTPNAAPSARVGAANPSSLSYTAIAEYERCAYRYHLQRAAGLPDVAGAGGGEGAAARGVLIHALLERFDFAAPRAPGSDDVATAAALAGAVLERDEDAAAIAALAGAFARSPLCARLAQAQELRREEPFAFLLGGEVLLRGFLDVAGLERDGTLLVVDYKSDRIGEGEDVGARLQRDYSMQRLVYALAGLASGAAAVEVAHCFLRRPKGCLLLARYGAASRPQLEAELMERLAPLRAGRFEVSPDPQRDRCATCPGRARLCSYEESRTLSAPSIG